MICLAASIRPWATSIQTSSSTSDFLALSRIRYIAAHQVAPVSAITHVAEVSDIQPWEKSNKYVVNFKRPASEIRPIKLVQGGSVKAPQAPRYTSFERIKSAETLDQAFAYVVVDGVDQ